MASRSRSSPSLAALTTRSPTGSSSVCSLKRSRRGHGSTFMNSPSTRRWRVAARLGPLGEVGVDALARDDQRREQADVLAGVVAQQLRGDALGALRRDRRAVVDAVLQAELDVEQAQEVPDLGRRRDRALAAAARQALLDRHRRRDAVDRVDLGPAGRLHDRARVGVERFEVAPLAFVEQDVERERRLARARDAGDDAELAARDRDVERLQVVLARVDDADVLVDGAGAPAPA